MEVCKICGELLDILTHIHCEKHGLTKEEYRRKYGNNISNNFRLPKFRLDEAEKYTAMKLNCRQH